VLEHVSNLDAVISEAARALKPGGFFLFEEFMGAAETYGAEGGE
jgi:2-polyprenyl-3-methyl-5-hydroxy-6-metoxy-1,4-benzoquinol methylase